MLQSGVLAGESQLVFDSGNLAPTDSGSADFVTIPDAHLLFHGNFHRSGSDLRLTDDHGKSFLVQDYFKHDKHPTLLSPDGAQLTAAVVDALAGPLAPGQYAQAGAPQPAAAQAIGRVATVSGNATVLRNGVAITLNAGDAILQGDAAQTGSNSALGLIFTDGTTFNLTSNARMVLNEFVYSQGGSNNGALINLVQGSITFIAGQVAKTGDMKVQTPVATMGIRGTAVQADIDVNLGTTKVQVLVERNNITGSFQLYANPTPADLAAGRTVGALLGTVNQAGIGWVVSPAGPLQVTAQPIPLSPAELQQTLLAVQAVFNTQDIGNQLLQQNPLPNPNTPDPNTKTPNPPPHTDIQPPATVPTFHVDVTPPANNNPQNNTTNPTNSGTTPDPTKPPGTVDNPITVVAQSNPAPLFEHPQHIVTRVSVQGEQSYAPQESAIGNYVAFIASKTLPLEQQHNNNSDQSGHDQGGDVYLFDRVANKLMPIAKAGSSLGGSVAEDRFSDVAISPDGKFLVFKGHHQSDFGTPGSSDAGPGPGSGSQSDLFIYDIAQKTVHLVGQGGGAVQLGGDVAVMENSQNGSVQIIAVDKSGNNVDRITGDTDLNNPGISAQGRYITFVSTGSHFTADGQNFDFSGVANIGTPQVFVFDRVTGSLDIVSTTRDAEGHIVAAGDAASGDVSVAASEFNTIGPDSPGGATGTTQWLASLSADGRYIAYQSNAENLGNDGDVQHHSNIFVYDQVTKQTLQVTVGLDGDSIRPEISADGKSIIFASTASNLVVGGTHTAETYVYHLNSFTDPSQNSIDLVSSTASGDPGNGDNSIGESTSIGGDFLAFGGTADNLAPVFSFASSPQSLPDHTIKLAGASVVDPSNNPGLSLLSVSVKHGTITSVGQNSDLTVIKDGSAGTLSLLGTLSAINAALAAGVIYHPDAHNDPDKITLTIDNLAGGTATVAGTINNGQDSEIPQNNTSAIFVVDTTDGTQGLVLADSTVDTLQTQGTLLFTDTADTHVASAAAVGTAWGTLTPAVTVDTTGTNTGGEIAWTYSVSEALAKTLAAGQVHTDTFAVTVTDSANGTAVQNVTVTTVGVNHDPVIAALQLPDPGPIVAPAGTPDPEHPGSFLPLDLSNSFSFSDADLSDHHTVRAVFDASASTDANPIGTFTADLENDTSNGSGGLVDWNFSVDPGLVNNLPGGHHVQAYDVTVFDQTGGSATHQVDIEIDGQNHAPVIDALLVPDPGPVTAPAGTPGVPLVFSNNFSFSDPDLGDTHTVTWARDSKLSTLPADFGNFTASELQDTSNGGDGIAHWEFTVDPASVNALSPGQYVEVYDVTVTDAAGATATHEVDITINGEAAPLNQPPTFTGDALGTAFAADGPAVAIATNVFASDVDSANYNGGSLTATVTQGGQEGDTLSIANGDFISVVDNTVMFDADGTGPSGAVAIGTLTDNINSLTVDLNSNADNAAVEALTQAIRFANTKPDPVIDTRTVTFSLKDGGGTANGGHDLTRFDATVDVTPPVNHNPVIADGTIATGDILAVPILATSLTTVGAADLTAGHDLVNGLGGPSGFGENYLPANDDGSTGQIDITSVFGAAGIDFFGQNYTSLYINNNGNLTFNGPLRDYTPSSISAGNDGIGGPIIAPFWADVYTYRTAGGTLPSTGGHSTGSDLVWYNLDNANGVMTITWDDVGYYASDSKENAFQVQLISEGNGNFDIVYRYENIDWTAGNASGGSGGLGGTTARAGYNAQDGVHYFELPQSGNQADMLALPDTPGNTGIPGVDVYDVRAGDVVAPTLSATGVINFSDPDLIDTHTISNVTYTGAQPEVGTLEPLVKVSDTTGTGTGGQFTWTYDVASSAIAYLGANDTKVESFDVTISDGHGGTAEQTVSVTLHGVNDAPTAKDDNIIASADLFHNGSVTIPGSLLLANDTDPDQGDTLSIASVGGSPQGGVVLDHGNVVYTLPGEHQTPANGASDSFNYTIADTSGATSTAHVTLTAQTGTALVGTSGNDVIVAGPTAHTLTGGGGTDTFVFIPNPGGGVADTITDFSGHSGLGDKIDLSAYTNISDIHALLIQAVNAGHDTLIDLGGGNSITLQNVNTAPTAQDFHFHQGALLG